MKKFFSRFINVPETNKTKQIEVPDMWEVRWTSRHGEFTSDYKPEVQGFYSYNEAEDFKESLENAFKLLRYKHSNFLGRNIIKVTINKVE